MGLDMYLRGSKMPFRSPRMEDDFKVSMIELELGYWRKHPNLHGYIVQTFADGVDECQDIHLDKEQLEQIIGHLESGAPLPHTTGFFFGASGNTDEERQADLEVFRRALSWLKREGQHSTGDSDWRHVYYRASW